MATALVATKQAGQGVSALPVTGTGMAARDGSGALSIWIALLLVMLGFVGIAFVSRWHAWRKRGQ